MPMLNDEPPNPPLDPIDELIRIVGEQGTDRPSRRAKVLTLSNHRRRRGGGWHLVDCGEAEIWSCPALGEAVACSSGCAGDGRRPWVLRVLKNTQTASWRNRSIGSNRRPILTRLQSLSALSENLIWTIRALATTVAVI